jgi:hypothetical protein
MKVNFEVDLTPVEARALMGLPDLTPIHEQYVATLKDTMKNGISPDLAESVIRSWSSTGEAGLQFWRKLLEGGTTKA